MCCKAFNCGNSQLDYSSQLDSPQLSSWHHLLILPSHLSDFKVSKTFFKTTFCLGFLSYCFLVTSKPFLSNMAFIPCMISSIFHVHQFFWFRSFGFQKPTIQLTLFYLISFITFNFGRISEKCQHEFCSSRRDIQLSCFEFCSIRRISCCTFKTMETISAGFCFTVNWTLDAWCPASYAWSFWSDAWSGPSDA